MVSLSNVAGWVQWGDADKVLRQCQAHSKCPINAGLLLPEEWRHYRPGNFSCGKGQPCGAGRGSALPRSGGGGGPAEPRPLQEDIRRDLGFQHLRDEWPLGCLPTWRLRVFATVAVTAPARQRAEASVGSQTPQLWSLGMCLSTPEGSGRVRSEGWALQTLACELRWARRSHQAKAVSHGLGRAAHSLHRDVLCKRILSR